VPQNEEQIKTTKVDPEKLADETAVKVVKLLGKSPPVRRIRNSQLLSLLLGAAGFSLFTTGLGKLGGLRLLLVLCLWQLPERF